MKFAGVKTEDAENKGVKGEVVAPERTGGGGITGYWYFNYFLNSFLNICSFALENK